MSEDGVVHRVIGESMVHDHHYATSTTSLASGKTTLLHS